MSRSKQRNYFIMAIIATKSYTVPLSLTSDGVPFFIGQKILMIQETYPSTDLYPIASAFNKGIEGMLVEATITAIEHYKLECSNKDNFVTELSYNNKIYVCYDGIDSYCLKTKI